MKYLEILKLNQISISIVFIYQLQIPLQNKFNMSDLFLLYESASGYALFKKEEYDEVAGKVSSKVLKAVGDLERFSKMVKLQAYKPFTTAEEALENITAIA